MDRGAWRATVHGGRKESDTTERLNSNNMGPKHQWPHPSMHPGPLSISPHVPRIFHSFYSRIEATHTPFSRYLAVLLRGKEGHHHSCDPVLPWVTRLDCEPSLMIPMQWSKPKGLVSLREGRKHTPTPIWSLCVWRGFGYQEVTFRANFFFPHDWA